MIVRQISAATAAATVILCFAGTASANTVPCSGPFKQCAIEVGAFCEMENGKMMIWYKDREGASRRFEECIGKVYEAHGKRNPYKPASSQPQSKQR
jgi:hypothetical protein